MKPKILKLRKLLPILLVFTAAYVITIVVLYLLVIKVIVRLVHMVLGG